MRERERERIKHLYMKVAQRYLQSEKQRKESERIKHLYKNNKTANLRSNGERETDARGGGGEKDVRAH